MPDLEEIDMEEEFAPGSAIEVEMHDRSRMCLGKLHENLDPTDCLKALDRAELGPVGARPWLVGTTS